MPRPKPGRESALFRFWFADNADDIRAAGDR